MMLMGCMKLFRAVGVEYYFFTDAIVDIMTVSVLVVQKNDYFCRVVGARRNQKGTVYFGKVLL